MDIASHALASFALARGFFPRRPWPVFLGIIAAGTLTDLDAISVLFGPTTYFVARRTFTHSLFGIIVVVILAALITRFISKTQTDTLRSIVPPLVVAATLHVLMDLFQSEGVALFWPIRPNRFALDWLPGIDPWIFAFLVAGILLPELFRLVGSEIGVKDKSPRGRNGAVAALSLVFVYAGARGQLHSESLAALEPHSYHRESARQVGSFPDPVSLLTWHGLIETESLLCQVDVPLGPGSTFDPEVANCLHKPGPSPELDAAQKSDVARKYLQAVPFPRATVAKMPDGYEIVLRSMRDLAEGATRYRTAARIEVDSKFGIASEEFIWLKEIHLR